MAANNNINNLILRPNVYFISIGRGRRTSQRYTPNGLIPLDRLFDFRRERHFRPLHRSYWSYSARLRSFDESARSRFFSEANFATLADAGFFYTGFADGATCYSCGILWDMWSASDDPWIRHASLSPYCFHIYLKKGSRYAAMLNNGQVSVEEPTREARDERLTCKICYVNEVNIVFYPCEHAVACSDCASRLEANDICPFCRTELTDIYRLKFVD